MQVSSEIQKKLEESRKILIIISRPMDYDCLGGGIVLKHQLQGQKKEVRLVTSIKVEDYFDFLPCIDEVEFEDILKMNMFDYDLIIALDGGNKRQFAHVVSDADFDFGGNENVLNVDHHMGNSHFAKYEIWNKKASSTTELLMQTLIDIEKVDKDEATLLYAGLVGDTGNFKYNFTSKTLAFAEKLLSKGADYVLIVNSYFYCNQAKHFEIMAWLLKHTKYNYDLKYSYVSYDMRALFDKFDCKYEEVKGGVRLYESSFSRAVDGINVSFVISKRNKSINIAMKGNQLHNKIPLPTIGKELGAEGGGHFNSAGYRVTDTQELKDVEERIVKVMGELNSKYKIQRSK